MNMDADLKNAEVSNLQDEVEDLKEQLHSAHLKMNASIAAEKHAIEEIESLHRNLEDEKISQNKSLFKLEEELKNNRKTWKYEVENLKVEHEEKTKKDAEKIECLEKELLLSKEHLELEAGKCSQSMESLNAMAESLAIETQKRERAELASKEMEGKMMEMHQKLTEVMLIKEAKEEVMESLKEKLMQAEEEVALYSSQLRELQGPANEQKEPTAEDDPSHKGNSLFAEVDDRRQLMKLHLVNEKKKNAKLEIAYRKKCSETSHLQAQLLDITRMWKDESKETISSQETLIASLKSRIEYLEKKVKSLVQENSESCDKRVFSGRKNGEPLAEYKYIEMDLDMGRKEIKELREKLDDLSMVMLIRDEEAYELKSSLRRLRAENAHLMRITDKQRGSSNGGDL